MMPRGFKPVGWVAAVGGAALGCYMLSLNVAAERAELTKIEREIVLAKQEIRALQTELGTRGRLQQLEHWNAEVLALSAPSSAQFLEDAVTLARFEQREKTIDEKAKVQLAAADAASASPVIKSQPEFATAPARKLPPVRYAVATDSNLPQPLLRQASYVPGDSRFAAEIAKGDAKPVAAKPQSKKADAAKAEPKKADAAKAEPKKVEPKKAERAAEAKKSVKPSSIKTLVAALDDDKPAATSGGGRSKAEVGLR